jgi:hypothetical protein
MWTIGFQPNGCASPVLLRKDGEMLAFAHIPTGNHNNQEGFIVFDFEGRGGRGRGVAFSFSPALRESVRPRAPSRIKGRVRYFFAEGEGKKSSGPAGVPALLTGPPPRRFCRSQGRDGGMGFRIEHRDGGLSRRRFDGEASVDRNGFGRIPGG